MITCAQQLMEAIMGAVEGYDLGPQGRVIFREGPNGPERSLEHVKVRMGIAGPELVLEGSVAPNDR